MPEDPMFETEEQRRRKRRLLERLRNFGREKESPRVVDLTGEDADQKQEASGELFNRKTAEVGEADAVQPEQQDEQTGRIQSLGRRVLEQAWTVHGFAEELSETVEALPEESRDLVASEAERLQVATGELRDAAEELDEELDNLEPETEPAETEPDELEGAEPVGAAAPAETESEPEKPKKDRSEAMGMARLVIATLIGGGLGALIGEGRKKESKEAAKAKKVIKEQKAKIEAQEAELQQLKATKPEAGGAPQKEYIKKASELTERQTEITHTTVEQVRAIAKETSELEKTFKIPESQPTAEAKKPTGEKLLPSAEIAERHEPSPEQRNEKPQQEARSDGAWPEQQVEADNQVNKPLDIWSSSAPAEHKANQISARSWAYGALLAVAVLIAAALLIFS